MDFLGLRTLTVIQNAVRLAEKDYGITIDIDQIDFNDRQVLSPLGPGGQKACSSWKAPG